MIDVMSEDLNKSFQGDVLSEIVHINGNCENIMKKTKLGEFGELVLLTVVALQKDANALR